MNSFLFLSRPSKLKLLLLSFLLSLSLSFVAHGQAPEGFETLNEFPDRVKKITLENGLRAVMVERPGIPTISFAVFVRTGGLDDPPGQSGLAHMFEHMLFKGTKVIGTKDYSKEAPLLKKIDQAARALDALRRQGVPPENEAFQKAQDKLKALQGRHEKLIQEEEFWKIYEQAGAQGLNAGTGYDYTTYTVSLPKNQLKLWVKMEAERIKNPVLREFYKERDVVLEERRMRVDTNPQGKLYENFLATAYQVHPYGRPIIGWKDEVSFVTVDDAEKFFKKHYDVSRLVIAMVGGFDAKEAEKLIRDHFGPIPSALKNETYVSFLPKEPEQEGLRQVEVVSEGLPRLIMGFHRPDMAHPDHAALDVLSDILSSGRSSRFQKQVVEKKKIAISAYAYSSSPGSREPNLFVMGGEPLSPHTVDDLAAELMAQVAAIKKNPPSAKELNKVKNFTYDYMIRNMASNSGLARNLGFYEAVGGDWKTLFKLIEEISKVTPEDVQRVAQTYLTEKNMTLGFLVNPDPSQKNEK